MNEQSANRLANSASPYLRSAAHQPVQWFEWGEEAFARACAEDKPILLDIGAVWCHWCHVIDRESYEDPLFAELINRLFIPIKVDRDERPDVDARYQVAIHAISGQGGWPLTGFLLPDGRPFYGGAYFPPRDAMGQPSFRRVIEHVVTIYTTRRHEIEQAASGLAGAVELAERFEGAHGKWDAGVIERLSAATVKRFDTKNGGFDHAPKFPQAGAIDFILEQHQATGDAQLLHIVQTTLEHMARGGVYDQIGGGFHRYSVDERWVVPHFEKMSYDNSALLKNYLHACQVTRAPLFRQTAEGIIDWVNAVLCDRESGGYYASQDADVSLDDDGDYFTWTIEEVRAALPVDQARAVELYYDVGPSGEMHQNPAKNVLWVSREPQDVAGGLSIAADEVYRLLEKARAQLLAVRAQRKAPFVDTTLYTNWNAMFVSAYFTAANVLDDWRGAACRAFALRTLDRFLAEGWDDRRGFTHRLGVPWLYGSLDDQAQMALALLDAFEATLDRRYFAAAERTVALLLDKYADGEAGGFFDRSADAPPMGGLDVRRKPLQDTPTPAGNPTAAMVLDRMYAHTGEPRFRQLAEATLEAFAAMAPEYGLFAAAYGLASAIHARHPLQIVVTGAEGDPIADALARAAHSHFRYGKAVLRVTPERLAGAVLPAGLQQTLTGLRPDAPLALVCAGMRCYPPVNRPEKLLELLEQIGRGSQTAAG